MTALVRLIALPPLGLWLLVEVAKLRLAIEGLA